MRRKTTGKMTSKSQPRDQRPRSTNIYLAENPEFTERKDDAGVTREYRHTNGKMYREFVSHTTTFGLPTYCRVSGIDPRTGKRGIAHGFLAIGPNARGVISVGQRADGVIAIGQLAVGRLFSLGQMAIAPIAIGQSALSFVGVGQAIVAIAGIGQFGVAGYGIFQIGVALWGGVGQLLYTP